MKQKQIKISFFDYLYYTIGTGWGGIEVLLIPFLWLAVLIGPFHIGWGISYAIVMGLVDYGLHCIYDKRGPAVRQYFDNTKYSKEGWKWLTFTVWVIVWMAVPFVIIAMNK